MPDNSRMPPLLESAQAALNVARDGLLLILLLLLLLVPSSINNVLTRAGFKRASMFGFDWEQKLESAKQETASAKKEVENLNGQLKVYAARMDAVAQSIAQPQEKLQASQIAGQLRATQATTQQISERLGRNLDAQKQLQNEFRKSVVAR